MACWRKEAVLPGSHVLAVVSTRSLANKTSTPPRPRHTPYSRVGVNSSGQADEWRKESVPELHSYVDQTNKSHEMLNTPKISHQTAATDFCSVVWHRECAGRRERPGQGGCQRRWFQGAHVASGHGRMPVCVYLVDEHVQ